MKGLAIPDAAERDPDSIEMIRVWIAESQLHCSLKIGMYKESSSISEEYAWGVLLADVTRHVASALQKGYDLDEAQTIDRIRANYNKELGSPTSPVEGEFIAREE